MNVWKSKYEALAKLYSQLRHEHLELLQKFKQLQLKAASAQEAIDRREKLEKEMKTKNLELADMIRERDRALFELDRCKGSNKEEVEKVKRELKFALEKAENNDRSKGTELSTMLARHNREVADLEELLRTKQRQIDDLSRKTHEGNADLERLLREREEELEIAKAGMDHTLKLLLEAENVGFPAVDTLHPVLWSLTLKIFIERFCQRRRFGFSHRRHANGSLEEALRDHRYGVFLHILDNKLTHIESRLCFAERCPSC